MKRVDLKAKKPFIISGPCSAETEEQTIETCVRLAETGMVDALRAGIWKPRTSPGSFEGVREEGLAWMVKARELTGLPIATEVATPKHVESALGFGVDILWIGARTTVSPFAVQDIADALKGNKDITLLIKNPMHPDIALWAGAVARFENSGIDINNIGLIHRGFSYFGASKYRNAPMWHLMLEMRSRYPDLPMLCDPSHICGTREYLFEISQTAADMRYDGLMIESHINPDKALSDASQQLTPADFKKLMERIKWRAGNIDDPELSKALEICRSEIDLLDTELFELLGRRMGIAEKIGEIKKHNNVAILQERRWKDIVGKGIEQAKGLGLSEEFIKTVLEAIHIESIHRQNKVMND